MAAKAGRSGGNKNKPKETTLESFGLGKDTELEMEKKFEKMIRMFKDEIVKEMRENIKKCMENMRREMQEERAKREEE